MTLDDYFQIGVTVTLGSHTFDKEAIIAFARKYDPPGPACWAGFALRAGTPPPPG